MSDDVMDQPWCCLTCSGRFRFGQIIATDVLRCPTCRSPDLHPATGDTVSIPKYLGKIGTLQ